MLTARVTTLGVGTGMIVGVLIQLGIRTMNKSFTVVELLVVVGIIAILASMLLSALSKAKEAAQLAECHNYRRQLTIFYYADGFDKENEEFPSYTIKELMLDHKIIMDKCYDCHASAP